MYWKLALMFDEKGNAIGWIVSGWNGQAMITPYMEYYNIKRLAMFVQEQESESFFFHTYTVDASLVLTAIRNNSV